MQQERNRKNNKVFESNNEQSPQNDLGFGTRITDTNIRFINPDGSFNVVRHGVGVKNLYEKLVTMPWTKFLMIVLIFYIVINCCYALLFTLLGIENTLQGMPAGSWIQNFGHAFFFSIQTFTTVGYGAMSPKGWMGNTLAAIDALTGSLTLALATGLLFARFSQAKADILFSKNALIAPYQGGSGLMIRISNMRKSQLYDVEAQMTMAWIEIQNDGQPKRKFETLTLERDKLVLFPLSWTLVHPITENSILYKKSEDQLQQLNIEVMIVIKAFDVTFAQMIHTQSSYVNNQVKVNYRFLPMFFPSEDYSHTILDLDLIDAIEKIN